MRLCIVEDHDLTLGNLTQLLKGERGIDLVGAFSSAEDALRAMDWRTVDVLLADIDLPGSSGIELMRAVRARSPSLNCMAFTSCEDRATVFSAIKAGASGYLLKSSSPRELVEALNELHAGGAPMTPKIARKVILDIQSSGTPASSGGLSQREIEILKLVEQGRSYKEISIALFISPHTVHTHIKNIYEKVQANTRAEALRKARNLGVL